MTTIPREAINNLSASINQLSEITQKSIRYKLEQIEYSDIADLRNQVIELLEPYLGAATDRAAAYAAEFYDSVRPTGARAYVAVAESKRAPMATEGALRAFIQTVVKTGVLDIFINKIMSRIDYELKRAAGACVMHNALKDPLKPKWARVPQGTETCGFCIMLASRGFDYHTAATAGERYHFHDHCDCKIVPGFGDDYGVEGYHPEILKQAWDDAINTVGTFSDEKSYRNATIKELERRDPKWVIEGKIPEIDSEPKELLDLIRKERSHEERTALRFSEHGYKTTFVPDERTYFDEVLGMNQTVGLADTKQGVEFKTILIAKKESTIDDYLRRAAKKENIRLVVFDAAESEYLTDVKIAEYIKNNMAKRRINEVLLIMSDNTLKLIKVAPTSPT